MSDYSSFFLNSAQNVAQLELLEIFHPSFSKTYRVVRNAIAGVTVTHEDGSVHTYDYYPLSITAASTSDDLDQAQQIQLGDLGQIIPAELDAVNAAGTFGTKPTVAYRTYRSDNLTKPLYGPINYAITSLSTKKEGSAFEAGAPKLNLTSTGEIYALDRFEMLRGFL